MAAPTIPDSASGVSMQRSAPNSSRNPTVTWKTPPKRPTSSPSTTTRGSRRISTRRASFTAWIRFISAMGGRLLGVADYRIPCRLASRSKALGRSGRRAKFVAHVTNRLDHGAAGSELGAQPAHVDVDGAGPAGIAVAPHPRQELLAGEHPARAFGQ